MSEKYGTINPVDSETFYKFGVSCICCGETVPLSEDEEAALISNRPKQIYKLCDECKEAIQYAKKLRCESYYHRRS